MGTAIKHPVADRIKPSFVIFHIWSGTQACECPDVKNYKWHLNLVWHKMLYSCIATLVIKRLTSHQWLINH